MPALYKVAEICEEKYIWISIKSYAADEILLYIKK